MGNHQPSQEITGSIREDGGAATIAFLGASALLVGCFTGGVYAWKRVPGPEVTIKTAQDPNTNLTPKVDFFEARPLPRISMVYGSLNGFWGIQREVHADVIGVKYDGVIAASQRGVDINNLAIETEIMGSSLDAYTFTYGEIDPNTGLYPVTATVDWDKIAFDRNILDAYFITRDGATVSNTGTIEPNNASSTMMLSGTALIAEGVLKGLCGKAKRLLPDKVEQTCAWFQEILDNPTEYDAAVARAARLAALDAMEVCIKDLKSEVEKTIATAINVIVADQKPEWTRQQVEEMVTTKFIGKFDPTKSTRDSLVADGLIKKIELAPELTVTNKIEQKCDATGAKIIDPSTATPSASSPESDPTTPNFTPSKSPDQTPTPTSSQATEVVYSLDQKRP